jgi:hypothetical protein
MRFVSVAKAGLPAPARQEFARSVGPRGNVTRWLRDGGTEIYQADGATFRKEPGASHFVRTCPNGRRRRVPTAAAAAEDAKQPVNRRGSALPGKGVAEVAAAPLLEALLPADARAETDPETASGVRTVLGEGGARVVAVVSFPDGSRLATFRDGTTIRTDPTRGHVLVECQGFPSAHLDLAVGRMARMHARGEKVGLFGDAIFLLHFLRDR